MNTIDIYLDDSTCIFVDYISNSPLLNSSVPRSKYASFTKREFSNFMKYLYLCILNIYHISSQDDYDKLLYIIQDCANRELEMDEDFDVEKFSKEVMQFYVKQSKENGEKFAFLRHFEDDGSVAIRRCQNLKMYIKDAIKKYNGLLPEFSLNDLSDKLVVSKQDIEEYNKMIKEREEEQKRHEEALKKRIQEVRKKPVIKTSKPKSLYDNPKYKKLAEIINPATSELKSSAINRSLDEILPILKEFYTDELDRIIEQYNDLKKKYKMQRAKRKLKTTLDKNDYRRIMEILEKGTNEEAKEELEDYLDSEEFESDIGTTIREQIRNIIDNKILKPTEARRNFIIFPTDETFDEEMSNFTADKTHLRIETVMGTVKNQLLVLESHTIQEITANKKDAFHEFKDCSITKTRGLKIGNLKFYRYGHRRTKVVLALVNISESNRKELSKIYGIDLSNIILTTGISSIDIEKEDDFYQRASNYCNSNTDLLIHIQDVFAKDFTDETRKEAINFIESGMNAIKEFNPTIGSQKKKLEN